MHSDILSVLISREDIKKKIEDLGKQITRDYTGKELFLICILRGSMICFSDLIREIELPLTFDFISASSYNNDAVSSQKVEMYIPKFDISNKDVIIVEDIVDTGFTINRVKKAVSELKPKSVALFSLLDKPSRRQTFVEINYLGFQIPDEFVVGYGLDYAQKYRNLKDICILKPEIYLNQ